MKINKLKPRVATLGPPKGVTMFDRKKHSDGVINRKKFYDSVLWQETRAAKLSRDPLCQACKFERKDVRADHVDHWRPLSDGGHPTHDDNLVSLCRSHHSIKTHREMTGEAFPAIVPSAPRTVSSFGFA